MRQRIQSSTTGSNEETFEDTTHPIYLGVDIAGANNTWASALSPSDDGSVVVHGPHTITLEDIVKYCEENDVVAVAIDA